MTPNGTSAGAASASGAAASRATAPYSSSSLRIVIIGATGMMGRHLVDESLWRGHRVIAVARRTDSLDPRRGLTIHAADAADPGALRPAIDGADVVVLTVRATTGQEHALGPLTAGVLDEAARAGARTVVIGGAGALRSPSDPGRLLVDDPAHVPEDWRALAGAGIDQLEAGRARPQQDWTYVSPPAQLADGPAAGRYRRGTDTLLTDEQGISRISAADLALAVLDEIEHPGTVRHWTAVQA